MLSRDNVVKGERFALGQTHRPMGNRNVVAGEEILGMWDRICDARERLKKPTGEKWSLTRIATDAGIETNRFTYIKKRERMDGLSAEIVFRLSRVLRVSAGWLLCREGTMEPPDQQRTFAPTTVRAHGERFQAVFTDAGAPAAKLSAELSKGSRKILRGDSADRGLRPSDPRPASKQQGKRSAP